MDHNHRVPFCTCEFCTAGPMSKLRQKRVEVLDKDRQEGVGNPWPIESLEEGGVMNIKEATLVLALSLYEDAEAEGAAKFLCQEVTRLQNEAIVLKVDRANLAAELKKGCCNVICYTEKLQLEAENKKLKEGISHIINIGHNLDCIFCGFKDKKAVALLDKEE